VLAPKIEYEPVELIKVLYAQAEQNLSHNRRAENSVCRLEPASPSLLPSRGLMRCYVQSPTSSRRFSITLLPQEQADFIQRFKSILLLTIRQVFTT